MQKGIIVKSISNKYVVEVDDKTYLCNARGILKKNNISPMVGDYAKVINLEDKEGTIEEIIKRKNQFIRPVIANIDQMIIIVSIKDPIPDLYTIDKQIVYCLYNNAEPVICINKIDLDIKAAEEIAKIYEDIGYTVILTSSEESIGIDRLQECLKGKITAFAGNSGVGKSSLTNKIFGSIKNVQGDISQRLGRGKHTTRHTELFKIDEATYIADTPGFSNLELLCDIKAKDIREYFVEFKDYNNECQYQDCVHVNEKKCKVKEELASGNISEIRYRSYILMYNELKEKEDRKYK